LKKPKTLTFEINLEDDVNNGTTMGFVEGFEYKYMPIKVLNSVNKKIEKDHEDFKKKIESNRKRASN